MILSNYRESQDAQVIKQAREQIEYCEKHMARKTKALNQSVKLIEALNFVSVATTKISDISQEHVRLRDGWLYAANGILSAGHPIEENLNCCPHGPRFLAAVVKSGVAHTMSLTEANRLSVKGDKFRAVLECLPEIDLPPAFPDAACAPLDDRVKVALAAVGTLVSEAADNVIQSAVKLQAYSAQSTNRQIAIEYWHGIDLPPNLIIPKTFIQAINKQTKPLVGFGFSDRSVTFHYEDKSWIKTQLYEDEYPDINRFFDNPSIPSNLPENFFEAAESVSVYNDNEWVRFADNQMQSYDSEKTGAQYEVPGLQAGKCFDWKHLNKIKSFCKQIDYTSYPDRMFFFGENVRGVAMCIIGTDIK